MLAAGQNDSYAFVEYDSRDSRAVQFYIQTIDNAPYLQFTYLSEVDERWLALMVANDRVFFLQDNHEVTSAVIAAPYDSERGFQLMESPVAQLNLGNRYEIDYSRDRPESDQDVPVENRGWSPKIVLQYLTYDGTTYSLSNTPTAIICFRIADWLSGRGTRPQLGFIGINNIVADVNNAAIVTLPPGPRGTSGDAGTRGTIWTEQTTLPTSGQVVGDMNLFPEAVASGLVNYFQADGTTAKADAAAGEVARWDGTKWRFVMVLLAGSGLFVDMHDGLRAATADDYGKVGVGPDGKLYRVKRTATPGHDAAGTFNAYSHAQYRGVAHNRPSNPQDGEIYYNIRIHQWYLFFINRVVSTIDAQPITPVQALGANTIWLGEVDDVYQARHAIQDFDNTKAYYAVYGETLYVLDNTTYTAATTGTTYTYQWIESLPDDVVTTAELEATLEDKLLPAYPPTGSRNDKVAKFDGDSLGWEYDGQGLTPQQKAQYDSLVAKTADLLLETRETWVAATDASFLALPADNAQLARVRAGNVPQGLTGWTTDVTTTDARVILIRVPVTAQLADYRILLGNDNAVRLDSYGVDATGTQYAYMTSTSLSLQEASRIRLQHHGNATHTRYIGMLANALMERLLPDLPAEGSRDNKVAQFDGDNLIWQVLTNGGGLTTQQIEALLETELAAYGLGFIGIYPRYMRFDQLEDNIIIAFGEIHEPYDEANRIEVSFNGVQVVRNEWSPATRFFRFGIEPTGVNNIINNTHRDAIHWDVQITFFKDGFLDENVIGNIRTIPVIINRELEPPDIFEIQSQLSRAVEWSTIPNDTAIPNNYIVRNGGRYFGAKVAHTKTASHVTPPGDPTNWIELSNGTATFSAAQLARLLPELPAEGSRDNKAAIFDGNNLAWELLTASGLTSGQLARLLPTLPAEGSRDDKIPKFNGDVLGWEDDAGGTADGKVLFGDTNRPANNVGKIGDTYLRRQSNGIGLYEKTAAEVWTYRYAILLLPSYPSAGSRDDKILRFADDVLGWEDLNITAEPPLVGVGAPATSAGVDNQMYFDESNGRVYLKSSGTWTEVLHFVTDDRFNVSTGPTPNRGEHLPPGLPNKALYVLESDSHFSDKYYKFLPVIQAVSAGNLTGANAINFGAELPTFGSNLPSIFRANRIAALFNPPGTAGETLQTLPHARVIVNKALFADATFSTNNVKMKATNLDRVFSFSVVLELDLEISTFPTTGSPAEMAVGGETYIAFNIGSTVDQKSYFYQMMQNTREGRTPNNINFQIYQDQGGTIRYLSDDSVTAWADAVAHPAGLYEGDANEHPQAAIVPPLATWNHVVARSNTFFSGTGPDAASGVDGQFWVNLRTGQIYQKQSGTWTLITDVALQTEISRAIDWSTIPNNTQIPANFITKHSNRYFGAKASHVKASGSTAPTGDTTNWIELSNEATTGSSAQTQVWADIPNNQSIPLGTLVNHGGLTFAAIVTHNKIATGPDGDATNWLVATNYGGDWSAKWWPPGMIVRRNGNPYISTQTISNSDVAPDHASNTKWLRLNTDISGLATTTALNTAIADVDKAVFAELGINASLVVPQEGSTAIPLTYAASLEEEHNSSGVIGRATAGNAITLKAGSYRIDVDMNVSTETSGENARTNIEFTVYNGATLLKTKRGGYLRSLNTFDEQAATTHFTLNFASDATIQIRVKMHDNDTGDPTITTQAGGVVTVTRIGT